MFYVFEKAWIIDIFDWSSRRGKCENIKSISGVLSITSIFVRNLDFPIFLEIEYIDSPYYNVIIIW